MTAAPTHFLRRALTVGCGVCLLICGVWASFLPTPPLVDLSITVDTQAIPQVDPGKPFNTAAFHVPLWIAPPVVEPPPVVTAVTPPPPAPLRWQLLAIIQEESTLKAMVYDPDTDKVYIMSRGDHLGSRTISNISSLSIHVQDTQGSRVLALHDTSPQGRP